MPKRQIWELQNERETLRLQADAVKRQLTLLGLEPTAIEKLEHVDLTQASSLVDLVQTVPVRSRSLAADTRACVSAGERR
jgi:hypothetical protein